MWLGHNNFSEVFEQSWNNSSGSLLQKSEFLAKELQQWNKNVYGNIFKRKKILLARLCGIQKALGYATNPFLINLEKDLIAEYNSIRDAEAIFWKQKSRDKWLQDGDKNSKFFHLTTVIRRRKNKIVGLLDVDGCLFTEQEKMQQIAASFFKILFAVQSGPNFDLNTSCSFPSIPGRDLNNLCRPVRPQEIYDSLFHIGRFKAPGYDGFPAAFFQDQWHVCGPDVINYVTSAFENSSIPEGLNHTLIALVPKTACPQEMKLFRPISLCCTSYKIISKIIVARLRPFLCNWVSPNQVSYVPGRHISDNVMIVQELIHKFRHFSGKKGLLAWKIDLSKAYDKLSWDFIFKVLTELQIPSNLINLIMSCISTTSFQVLVNGELSDSFHANSGIRQGDPLSPYIFVLCMEKLSHLIQDGIADGYWKPIKATRFGPLISHLFFADDLILFSEASTKQAGFIKNTMDIFCKASGQSVNFDKSVIFISPNISANTAAEISSICGSPLTDDLGRYLGMPIIHSRVGKHTYASLIDKVQSRLASWKSKTLNIAGRLTLIQSVTSAIPIYAMQTTKLPIHTCDKLDSINRGFLWGDTADQKKIHLVNWQAVCKPKILGGLGVKRTRDMNQAMLAKASWRILQNDKGLWCKIFKNKYLVNSDFPQNYHKPAACSNVWSSICHGSKLLQKGLKWRIGNGSTVKFWLDYWTEYGPLTVHAVNNIPADLNTPVCDFWIQKCWNIHKLSEYLPPEIVDHISAIPISSTDANDIFIWKGSANGDFTVNSAYLLKCPDPQPTALPWAKIWKLHIPPKMKIFMWTIIAKKLLTNEHRMHRKFTSDPSCFHCPGTPETMLHLFRDCPKARLAWNSIFSPCITPDYLSLNWNDWLAANIVQTRCISMTTPWNIIFIFLCWHIWKWRCKCIFDSSFNLPFDMRHIIFTYISEWSNATRKNPKSCLRQLAMLCWDKPPPGILKVNVDGSMNNCGKIGAGGVLRDCTGTWSGGFMAHLGSGDILQAEAWGIFYGLQLALRHGVQHVELESDSNTVVSLILQDNASHHPLGTVISNCRTLQAAFLSCSIKHVHREQNLVADHLAKASLGKNHGTIWLNTAPNDISAILLEDIAGTARMRMIPQTVQHCSVNYSP